MIGSIILITVCLAVLVLWALYFPNPSPLIRPLLPPKQRWPEAQIRQWVQAGRPPKSFLRFFERDPERCVPTVAGLVAPADGVVTSATIRAGTRYVVIALSFWDIHVQRSPCDGVVESVDAMGNAYTDGEGRDFAFLREKRCPVQTRIAIRSPRGVVAVRLITSLSARRLQTWFSPGDEVTRGQRLGRIRLGSTVVLEMPAAWDYALTDRQRVRAGETLVETPGSAPPS